MATATENRSLGDPTPTPVDIGYADEVNDIRASLRDLDWKIDVSHRLLANGHAAVEPSRVFALVSGGYDSLSAMVVALHSDVDVDGVVHANTGIGIERTRAFVREQCAAFDVPYIEGLNRTEGERWEDMVREYGFHSPETHVYAYRNLKERVIEGVVRAFDGDILFVSGARVDESLRRMENIGGRPLNNRKRDYYVNAILHWTGADTRRYKNRHGIPDNEVRELLGISGECLCGSFANRKELDMIRRYFPEVAERIANLEREVQADPDIPQEYCAWGHAKMSNQHREHYVDLEQTPLCGPGCWIPERE